MQNRDLNLIKNDLKIVSTNKLNSSQSKLLLIGIIFEMLQRKDLFPKNSDLKMFVQQVFIDPIEGLKPFKEYLFVSRTLLGSRVSKIILYNFEYSNVLNTVEKLSEILPNQDSVNKNSSHTTNDDGMNEWINFIRGNVN